MNILRARKLLPLYSAILFSMCPLNFFRAIRATFRSPVGLNIFETSDLPASGSINRLNPGCETSAPTVKDAYPIPRIYECLDSLSGSKWFSCMDLGSGRFEWLLRTNIILLSLPAKVSINLQWCPLDLQILRLHLNAAAADGRCFQRTPVSWMPHLHVHYRYHRAR